MNTQDRPTIQNTAAAVTTNGREKGRLSAKGGESRFVLVKGGSIIGIYESWEKARAMTLSCFLVEPTLTDEVLTYDPPRREPPLIYSTTRSHLEHILSSGQSGPPDPVEYARRLYLKMLLTGNEGGGLRHTPDRPTVHYTEVGPLEPGSTLNEEDATYRREVGRLLAEGQEGRFVLIVGETIIGIYDSWTDARTVAECRFPGQPTLTHQILTREPIYFVRR
jgi:hypothetical protein